ncbi:MAG: hypothetical protein H0T49_10760 [Chloroflexia bacterium]|nr:hypothetical protein [Chloroflexia bacterium]
MATHRPIFEPLESGKVVYLPDLPAEAFAPQPSDPARGRAGTEEGFRRNRAHALLTRERSDAASSLALSAPLASIALAMGLPALFSPRLEIGALSFAYVLALLVIAAGFSIARLRGESLDVAGWTTAGVTIAILTPLLAVQTETVRTPYVGAEFGTLRPVTLLTASVLAVLIGLAAITAFSAAREPEHAGFVFVFPALLVPAISSVPQPISQLATVEIVAAVSGFAAIAVLFGRLARRGLRPFICPVVFALLIGALATTGRRWLFEETSGGIVRALPLALLGVTILLVVATPLLALYVRAVTVEITRRDDSQS